MRNKPEKLLRLSGASNSKSKLFFLAILFYTFFCLGVKEAAATIPVFDSIQLIGKPDLAHYGLTHIAVLGHGNLWSEGEDDRILPLQSKVLSSVRTAIDAGNTIICLDIEHWETVGTPEAVNATITKLATIAGWAKAAYPEVRLGYYGLLPRRDYWRAIKSTSSVEYREWQSENDMLAPLIDSVDVLFPSVYQFYADVPNWIVYAKAQVSEARRYGAKPVYAFD
jgi:hypothetical protein